jgi:NTE family protein
MIIGSDVTVVCGGGGLWGAAWMTGLIAGLADAGVDMGQAGAFIGTSAGSVVSSQLTSNLTIAAMFERQVNPAKQTHEAMPMPGALEALGALMSRPWPDPAERLGAICELAKTAPTISRAERRAGIVERLGLASEAWPDKKLSITAIDLETQELTVFTAASGISLIDAVCASCAVPGVWPPAEVKGRLYIDGGVWKTAENAHLAQHDKQVIILAPLGLIPLTAPDGNSGLAADIAALEAQGSEVLLISADAASLRSMGGNFLDLATRKSGAEAGRLQAAAVAAELRGGPSASGATS